jgi:hypothetical protein
MINGVKITLVICLTILVSCVLCISYNEYTNRYSIVAANDNALYIFDKKSAVLNRCSEKGCELIETKLPSKVSFGFPPDMSQSKLFGSEKTIRDTIVKTEAVKSDNKDKPRIEQSKTQPDPAKPIEIKPVIQAKPVAAAAVVVPNVKKPGEFIE